MACAGGTAFVERLNDADVLSVPGAHWSDLSQLWIWLPPHTRPAALDGLGAGAGLTRVVEAVEAAHPDLRERFRTQLAEELEQDPDEDGRNSSSRPAAAMTVRPDRRPTAGVNRPVHRPADTHQPPQRLK
ncbi:hypothetical protein [Streptomyces sp. SP2-10]|uniref:hypothetical protein n=1 Tax=Streptomyces sp. SP2-10 TaxID=2873385 RepID=UPI001CA7874E|nr:hypothetical protein [Streptomyces sp. SP2-10]MBY8847115.1 hypothetical protein [Streptomyces sp. SP2-10]